MRWEDKYAQEIFLVHSIGNCSRALLLAGNASWAASTEPAVRLLSSMAVPVAAGNTTGGMYSFDISFVDQATGTYYLADRSNKAVDAVDAESIVTQIVPNNGHAAFAGFTPVRSRRPGPTIAPVPTASWRRSHGSL